MPCPTCHDHDCDACDPCGGGAWRGPIEAVEACPNCRNCEQDDGDAIPMHGRLTGRVDLLSYEPVCRGELGHTAAEMIGAGYSRREVAEHIYGDGERWRAVHNLLAERRRRP
jgi:hypothetical protein